MQLWRNSLIYIAGSFLVPVSAQEIPWAVPKGFTVEVFADSLFLPVNIAFVPAPDSSEDALFCYVTELYGRVSAVSRNGTVSTYVDSLLNFNPTGGFPGSGELGVTGIAVETATGDLIVSMVYVEGSGIFNRLVRMTSADGGWTKDSLYTLLEGIPGPGQSHQIHTVTLGPDGMVYVNVGDGEYAESSQDDDDLRGKILRLAPDGSIPPDNPVPGSYVYAKGLRNPFGATWRNADDALYISDNGPDENDRLARVEPGSNLGWCCDMTAGALHLWTPTVSPVGLDFMEGSQFPEEYAGHLFVGAFGPTYYQGTSGRGKTIFDFTLDSAGTRVVAVNKFMTYTGQGFGTVVGVAFGPDGLYFTDIFGEDGFDETGRAYGNIYRITRQTGEDNGDVPAEYSLLQNIPNPFNAGTTIRFDLPEEGQVMLTIYDVLGRKVVTLVANEPYSSGSHAVLWDGKDQSGQRVSSGVYLVQIQAGNFSRSRKMLLLK